MNQRLKEGSVLNDLHLRSIHSTQILIPDSTRLIHLQFRRFAGCPVCDLHLHSMVRRHDEIEAASVQEVVVFHSSAEELLPFCKGLPFEIIADPGKKLYAQFGVESALQALVSPLAWGPILRGVLRSLGNTLIRHAPLPSFNPAGGRLGLPADFLIAPNGVVVACKYGSHAYDQWSVNDLLALAARAQAESTAAHEQAENIRISAV